MGRSGPGPCSKTGGEHVGLGGASLISPFHDTLPALTKLKLVNPSQYRFEHLVTQMKWRLQEGRGEAVYQIGVEDNGLLVGLAEEEMRASLKTLHRMAEKYASPSFSVFFPNSGEDPRVPSHLGPEGPRRDFLSAAFS